MKDPASLEHNTLLSVISITHTSFTILSLTNHHRLPSIPIPKTIIAQGTKSYIVVFKDTAVLQAMENVEKEILAFGGKIGQRYSAALKGFSAWIPGPIVTALSTNPFIDYIEEDGEGKQAPLFVFHFMGMRMR